METFHTQFYEALEVTVKALETKLAANRSMMLWGFVIVGLLIWMR